jgi:hypothetical protein
VSTIAAKRSGVEDEIRAVLIVSWFSTHNSEA